MLEKYGLLALIIFSALLVIAAMMQGFFLRRKEKSQKQQRKQEVIDSIKANLDHLRLMQVTSSTVEEYHTLLWVTINRMPRNDAPHPDPYTPTYEDVGLDKEELKILWVKYAVHATPHIVARLQELLLATEQLRLNASAPPQTWLMQASNLHKMLVEYRHQIQDLARACGRHWPEAEDALRAFSAVQESLPAQ